MPVTLSIDTCIDGGSAAVYDGGAEIAALDLLSAGKQDPPPLHKIDELLVSSGLNIGSIDRIVVTRGPGSFTGVRTGLSIIRGLLRARGISYSTCTVMEALTEMADTSLDEWRTAIFAGKREAAVQNFERKGTRFKSVGKHFLVTREELIRDPYKAIIIGPGLASSFESEPEIAVSKRLITADRNIARLAYRFVNKHGSTSETASLEPVYTREFVTGRS
ncbi:MAG TPA: tRNA (adenosine(37)-N6)-threonylcarbamoyltransferase complex dimerization subunit type 1 TsaB [Aridibacter sp.]|nr:tRNA (adenosine(37)-N6)-threonylcarbamoyltransferase complex dimerization subunit type 1 TsaB [Aridibacter sp.]